MSISRNCLLHNAVIYLIVIIFGFITETRSGKIIVVRAQ